MHSVVPRIKQQTVHTNTAGTICGFSLQHSYQSRGNDGQNASHSAYTFYSALPSLVAGGQHKKRNNKDYWPTWPQCSVFVVYTKTMYRIIEVPVRNNSHIVAAWRNSALEESSVPVLQYFPLWFPKRDQMSHYTVTILFTVDIFWYMFSFYLCVLVRQNKTRIHKRHSEVQQHWQQS